ncbi:MAG TPA: hypothetical protein VL948_20320 [Verrucomicrobiae bacterium]|jgi:hypothetical protein|nr:hypothetical protein [Verrucomicrobiae bacterium]
MTLPSAAFALLLLVLCSAGTVRVPAASAQTYTPQSPSALTVTFQSERVGAGRVILFGDVRNSSLNAYERVTLLAEGLDETGAVVSRGRAYVLGTVPPRGSSSFECRLASNGRERRFRVSIEAFQIAGQSP